MKQSLRGRGTERDVQAGIRRNAHEIEGIAAHELIAACENEHRRLPLGELENQSERLRRIQLVGMPLGLGFRATMPARERTGARDFPKDEKRAVVEIVVLHGRLRAARDPATVGDHVPALNPLSDKGLIPGKKWQGADNSCRRRENMTARKRSVGGV
jgi:hypothetical protein